MMKHLPARRHSDDSDEPAEEQPGRENWVSRLTTIGNEATILLLELTLASGYCLALLAIQAKLADRQGNRVSN